MSSAKPTVNARGWRMDGVMGPAYRAHWGYSRRQAVRYNAAENADLLAQFEAGARIQDIADWHERTPCGVRMQIDRLQGANW